MTVFLCNIRFLRYHQSFISLQTACLEDIDLFIKNATYKIFEAIVLWPFLSLSPLVQPYDMPVLIGIRALFSATQDPFQ